MTKETLTDGLPVSWDRSHTRLKPNGQQEGYVVLSADERAKGFVRPVRMGYRHVGPPPPANLRDLSPEEHEQYDRFGYIKFEPYGPEKEPVTGCYWTQERLDRLGKGCGGLTVMAPSIAETYARQPNFYSGTFCVHCEEHFPVGENGEFVWADTDERVGT